MPQPMPVVSRNAPAYTNDDSLGGFPASHANNASYTDNWRCQTTPVGNADSGTLTQPVYLAFDLSLVPLSQRGMVLLVWYDDTPGSGPYDPGLIANNYYNVSRDYTVDVNAAAGGSLPTSGWVTKVTIAGNTYHSRQHLFDMTGYNWVRIRVTGVIGSAFNNNVAMDMDIHDAHLGLDSWIFYGDSITQRGLDHDDSGGIGNIVPAQINASKPAYWPVWECGGVGGWTATDMQTVMASTFLPLFPGTYVALPLGTNDATGGGALLTQFQSKMQSMVSSILAAGKIPVIPHIPWNSIAPTNVQTLNGYIDAVIAANPGAIAGPDLWAYFNANQSLISGDGIHPTDPAGYAAYRVQWANWATANIYLNPLNTQARSLFKIRSKMATSARVLFKLRSVLKTPARTLFKVQVVSTLIPYIVTAMTPHIVEHPYSTMHTKMIVFDQNGVQQDGLTASVTVTYPDASTASPSVYWRGNGLYEVIYNTKGVGTMTEVWTFTDALGSRAEYQNTVPCAF